MARARWHSVAPEREFRGDEEDLIRRSTSHWPAAHAQEEALASRPRVPATARANKGGSWATRDRIREVGRAQGKNWAAQVNPAQVGLAT
jgi:hypothetical protein